MNALITDIRFAIRMLLKNPGFTAIAVLTLALGIGATTAIFSVVNAVVLRPPPVHHPDRLVTFQVRSEQRDLISSFSLPDYREYRDRAGDAIELAAHHLSNIMLNTGKETTAALGLDVSSNYFEVLGMRPALGRFFIASEALGPATEPVAVISHALWQREFGGKRDVLGGTIHVNGVPLTVIGVAPENFNGTMLGARPGVWLPLGLADRLKPGRDPESRGRIWLQLFGRLAPGTRPQGAKATLATVARGLAARYEYPEDEAPDDVQLRSFSLVPPGLREGIAGFVTLLLATGGLVLAIAAVNVSAMLLARGVVRGREIAIRLALGARRRRLVFQLLVESLMLSILAAGAGIVLASWLTTLLETVRPPLAGSFSVDLGLDGRVLAFAILVSGITGILFGLAPALHATRRRESGLLKDGIMQARRTPLRNAMVAGQLALSLVLLVTAGLFVRTLQSTLDTDHRFDPEGVLAVHLNLRLSGYDEARGRVFYQALLERVRALPGTESASLASIIPLGFEWDQTRLRLPDLEAAPDRSSISVGFNLVSSQYFETLEMPILAGRGFSEADNAESRPVMVVNQTFAKRMWGNESPVGKQVTRSGQTIEVVGVVPDGKYRSYSEEPVPFVYTPMAQQYSPATWLHVRWKGDKAASIAAIRNEIRALDANMAPTTITTVENVLGATLFPQQLAARLVGGFGLIGLGLAVAGVFGLLSFVVVQRTREIGLRMALGAQKREIVGLVLWDGCKLLATGILAGLVLVLAVTHTLAGLLHGISPHDPVTLVAVCGVLAVVTLTAAVLPARRAASVAPMNALRHE